MTDPAKDVAAWSTRFAALDPYLQRPLIPVDVLKYVLNIADDSHEAFRRIGLRVVTFGRSSFISMPQLLAVLASSAVDEPKPIVEPADRSATPEPAVAPAPEGGGLSRDQAAKFLGIGLTTLDELVKTGQLRQRKIGRKVLFLVDELRTYLRTRRG